MTNADMLRDIGRRLAEAGVPLEEAMPFATVLGKLQGKLGTVGAVELIADLLSVSESVIMSIIKGEKEPVVQ